MLTGRELFTRCVTSVRLAYTVFLCLFFANHARFLPPSACTAGLAGAVWLPLIWDKELFCCYFYFDSRVGGGSTMQFAWGRAFLFVLFLYWAEGQGHFPRLY